MGNLQCHCRHWIFLVVFAHWHVPLFVTLGVFVFVFVFCYRKTTLRNSAGGIHLFPHVQLSPNYQRLHPHCHFKGYTNWTRYTDKSFPKKDYFFSLLPVYSRVPTSTGPTDGGFGDSMFCSDKLKGYFWVFFNALICIFKNTRKRNERGRNIHDSNKLTNKFNAMPVGLCF